MKRLEKIWILFFSMSILGWIYETVLEVCVYHWGFSNRGILTGPWLPIYGVGGLLFIGVCYTVVKSDKNRGLKLAIVFVMTALVATAVELGATYILEYLHGEWPWDYTRYDIHYEGRIALSTSIRFGLCGILGVFVIYPLIGKFCERIPKMTLDLLCVVTALTFITDVIATVIA